MYGNLKNCQVRHEFSLLLKNFCFCLYKKINFDFKILIFMFFIVKKSFSTFSLNFSLIQIPTNQNNKNKFQPCLSSLPLSLSLTVIIYFHVLWIHESVNCIGVCGVGGTKCYGREKNCNCGNENGNEKIIKCSRMSYNETKEEKLS